MRKSITYLVIGLLYFLGSQVLAQEITIPNAEEEFQSYFQKLTKKTKNEFIIQKWAETDSLVFSVFDQNDKEAFVNLSKTMARRYHKLVDFQDLFILNSSLHETELPVSIAEFYTKLNLLTQNYPRQKVVAIFKQLTSFLNQRLVYEAPFNRLYVFGDAITFTYTDKPINTLSDDEPVINENKTSQVEEEDFGLFDVWDTEDEEEDLWDSDKIEISEDSFGNFIQLPLVEGLLIQVKEATLVFVTESDSLILEGTTGNFDLLNDTFLGQGGKTTWENVFLPEIKVELDKFSFKTSTPQIKAEEATLTYENFLLEPIKGVFELKATKRNNPNELASYPRFKSYKNNAEFKLLDTNIEYIGGFSLVGNRVFSTSLFDNISSLYVNKGKENNFKAVAKRFEFTDSLITSNQVSFTTYLGKDSIYHPAVSFRYEPLSKELTLVKVAKGGFRNAMYSDTFHEMDIKSDALSWNLNDGKMDFFIISGKSEIPAVFESFNYYNPDRLRRLSNIVGWNPVILIGNHVYRKRKNVFELYELEKYLKKPPNQIKAGVTVAMEMGFIDYDPYTDKYALSRKGLHYYQSATGRKDYDDLVLASVTGGGSTNASIDRNSNALDISGTQEFKLSDSLGIRFLPKDQSMKMEGSNSFKFQGEIIVKNYRIIGDFDVDYKNFKVDLKRIDTISFIPIDLYRKGAKIELGANIKFDSKGTLYLNDPNNKSGRKKLVQYPKLEIPGGAIVTFNNPNRLYNYSEKVLFKIPSISQDSLNEVDMAYLGQFYSGGILPPITETLTVMPDTSIGFTHTAKADYQLYKTNSTFAFEEPLKMTKRGLTSVGKLNHISTVLTTESTFFYDTLLVAKGPQAQVKESFQSSTTYFPNVNIEAFQAAWVPEADSLGIKSAETLSFYEGSSLLTGSLVVRQSGLFGEGTLERTDSKTESEGFKFNKAGFLASKSTFIIKALSEDAKPILEGTRVDVDFKVDQNLALVSPIDGDFNDTIPSAIQFPNAAYKTTIDQATWDIKNQKITMEGDVDNSTFFATNPKQFGLKFNGAAADYDIKQNLLTVKGVPHIASVDALIVPANGEAVIKGGGTLEPFTNAKVIADSSNQYHVLTDANIKINSKLSYDGDAAYQYVNVSSDTFNIKISEFQFAEINEEGQILKSKKSEKLSTIATAKVTIADSIYLSPKIIYQGDITMLAPFKNLNLNGSVRPILEKYPFLGGNWINYKGSKSESIQINVDDDLKDGGKPLFAGLHLQSTTSSDGLYPTFLSAKRYEYDFDVFRVKGLFSRDEENKRFVIQSEVKNEPGNRYELYDDEGIIRMDGKLNLFEPDLTKYLETSGIATVMLDSLDYSFNTMLKYNFPIPQPLLLKMGESIVKTNLDQGVSEGAILFEDEEFLSKMTQFAGKKITENYVKEYLKGHIPLFKASPKFFASLLMSQLELAWDPVSNTLHNNGRIGVSNIGETDINAMMDGYFEIKKDNSNGDEIYLFLEVSGTEWYYLGYKNGQLGFMSSNFEVNKILGDKESAKSSKEYELITVDTKEAMDFRKRFLITYLGASESDFETRKATAKPGALKQVKATKKAEDKSEPEEEESDGF